MINKRKNIYTPSSNGDIVLTGVRKVIAIMGQSNIDGRADIVGLPSDIENPTPLVKYYQNSSWNDWDCTKPPARWASLDNSFAHDTIWLQRLAEDLNENIYIVKKSRGGTTFKQTTNVKGDWNISSTEPENHYLEFIRRLTNTKNYVEQVEFKNFELSGLVVDIFESDNDISDVPTLTTDFKNFITKIREFANNQNLPILHRRLNIIQNGVDQWVIDLQDFFANNTEAQGGIDNYYLVDGEGTTFFDGVHLDAVSNELLSDRFIPLVKTHFYNIPL